MGGLCIGMYAKRVVRGVFDTFNVPLLYPFQCFFPGCNNSVCFITLKKRKKKECKYDLWL